MQILKYSTLAIVVIVVGFCSIFNPISMAQAAPAVSIDPTCGPSRPGFMTYVTGSGFSPDSNINWELVNFTGIVTMHGHFRSNSQGGFYDNTYINSLPEGNYSINFGTDAGNATASVKLTIPCPNG